MMGERRIIPVTPNKRRAPALYELIGNKPPQPTPPPVAAAPSRAAPATAPAARPVPVAEPKRPAVAAMERELAGGDTEDSERVLGITPGSRLNIPVGFAFIGLAVVIAVVLGAYMLGYNKSETKFKADQQRQAAEEGGGIVDPTASPFSDLEKSAAARQPTRPDPVVTAPPANKPVAEPEKPAAKVYIVKSPKEDPRRDGLNYPTVATLPIKEATATAEYLVSKGYSAALVPARNDNRLFMVMPLVGLDREGYQKNKDSIERTLRDLGRAFKRDLKGAADFNDLFWVKYDK